MRFAVLVTIAMLGCGSKTEPLVDLSTLAPVRTAFNVHEGEARFLTLLSPT